MTFRTIISSLTVAMVAAIVASASASANMGPPAPPRPKVDCSKHANKHNPACANGHSQLNDDEIYESAYWNAKSGNYKQALAIVALAANKDDPRILRITGFATRKLGDVDGAMPYYQKALAINADDTLTREYMGEAFLTKGDMTSANAQLGEIAKRCGTTCEDYAKLAEAIATAGKSAKS
jgi:tetratricopeptide (TPR) repeat protein